MRKLKNLKMMLTVAFVIAAGVLFFYDGRKASDVQWETAEETASENESSGMVSGEDTKETESVSTEPENIMIDIADALQIVLDLARQNLCDEREMPEEHKRQVEACNVVEDMAVNQFGDD